MPAGSSTNILPEAKRRYKKEINVVSQDNSSVPVKEKSQEVNDKKSGGGFCCFGKKK